MKTKRQRRYPKAFQEYWDTVEYCGINEEDDFKYEAYLAWKEGTQNGPIRRPRAMTASQWLKS